MRFNPDVEEAGLPRAGRAAAACYGETFDERVTFEGLSGYVFASGAP